MAGSKSKTKGNGAERELAKLLSETLGGNFTRVIGSGAMTGGKNFFRKAILSTTQNRMHKGDIVAPDHLPKMVLESKFYADLPFHHFLSNGRVVLLDKWIEQSLDAVDPGDEWFVCFKINRKSWYVAVPEVQAQHYAFGNHAVYDGAHGRFRVTELASFFTTNKAMVTQRCA